MSEDWKIAAQQLLDDAAEIRRRCLNLEDAMRKLLGWEGDAGVREPRRDSPKTGSGGVMLEPPEDDSIPYITR